MKDKNREFEETGAFLDLMSKKERKRWEKEQTRLNEEENEKKDEKESNEDSIEEEQHKNEEVKNVTIDEMQVEQTTKEMELKENELEPLNDTVTQEEVEEEITKTKQLVELTQELNIKKEERYEEINEETSKTFNPITPLGITLIVLFSFFIYIVVASNYDNNTFLIVNSSILLFLTFCFGLTVLCNRRHVKIFAIFGLLIILSFVIFNGISITNYENIYNKVETMKEEKEDEKDKTVVDEKVEIVINEYNCTNEEQTVYVDIKEENNYITYIKRIETLTNNELALETISHYKDKDGITAKVEDATITIEFDFNNLDINQYKLALKEHNDSYRLDSDFSYIEEDKINYEKYINIELRTLTCTKKEN